MGIHGRDAAWRRALCASLASPGAAPAPAAQGSVMAFVLEADARGLVLSEDSTRGFQFLAFGTRRPWANGAPLGGERAMVKQLRHRRRWRRARRVSTSQSNGC